MEKETKIIKKWTALQLNNRRVDNQLSVNLSHGDYGYEREYGYESTPDTEFDSEEEAIKHAFNENKWISWLIVPIIRFDNFDDF